MGRVRAGPGEVGFQEWLRGGKGFEGIRKGMTPTKSSDELTHHEQSRLAITQTMSKTESWQIDSRIEWCKGAAVHSWRLHSCDESKCAYEKV